MYSCFVRITQFLFSFLEAIRFHEPKGGHGVKTKLMLQDVNRSVSGCVLTRGGADIVAAVFKSNSRFTVVTTS